MTIYNLGSIILYSSHGPVAQLGAHYIRIVGVGSSNLLGSTKKTGSPFGGPVFLSGEEIRTIQCSSPGDCCLPPAGRRQLQSVSNLLGSTSNTDIPSRERCFLSGEEIRTVQCSSPGDCCLPPAGRRQLQSVPNLLGSAPNIGIPSGEMLPPDKNGGGKICFTGCLPL